MRIMRSQSLLLHLTTIAIISTYVMTNPSAENVTNTTSQPGTTELETTQLYTTSKLPTSAPTQYVPTNTQSEEVKISVEITVSLSNDNFTQAQIRHVILTLIDEYIPGLTIQSITAEVDDDVDGETRISYKMVIIAPDDTVAELVEDTIESNDFKSALKNDIESLTNAEVNDINTAAAIVVEPEDEDEADKASWLDPLSYGLLNWIIVGAAICILCILCLFICRCCYLCCGKTKRRSRSGYQQGKPMFGNRSDAANDIEFQSDLRHAIEMNAQKKLLKSAATGSLGLEVDDVNAAFDDDLGTKLIGKKSSTSDEVKSNDNAGSDHDGDGGQRGIKKKGSEGVDKSLMATTTTTATDGNTPGGDDEDNPPPAPHAPHHEEDVHDLDDYDLL